MLKLNITVNGEQTRLAEGIHVVELLESLGLKPERLAVEVNRSIVRRADWTSTTLAEGDRVEIVHFVGGGASDEPSPGRKSGSSRIANRRLARCGLQREGQGSLE